MRRLEPDKALIRALVAGFLLSGAAANADEGAADETAKDGRLEEIVVTAERRETNIQKTPISITTLSGADLAARDLPTVDDALRVVPSVAINQSAKGGEIFIRGVGGALDPQIGSAAVNFNLDGRYQDQAAPVFASLYDVNRIEVLRGPQGTLYGRNATGGSVNVITNDPSHELQGAASVTVGNYGLVQTESMLNLPVTDTFAVRAAVASDKHDGYLSNGYANTDNLSARIKALLDLGSTTSILLTAEYSKIIDFPGTVLAPLTDGRADRKNPWEATDAGGGYANAQSRSIAAQVKSDLGFGALTFLSTYQNFEQHFDIVFAGQPGAQSPTDKQTTQELRIASKSGSPIEWIGGLYYLNTLKSDLVFTPASPPDGATTDYPQIKLTSTAAFGEVRIPIVQSLTAYAGLRYTRDTQDDKGRVYGGPPIGSDTPYFFGNGTWSKTNYRAGLEDELTSASLLYAQVATGYKAGGIYQGGPPDTYAPETLIAYTLGSKNRFAGDTIQVNAEAFYYSYKDYQVQTIGQIQPEGFGLLIYNAATATIYGGEIESIYKVTANDRFEASVAYLHGEFGNNFIVPSIFGPGDYSHYSVPHTPEFSGHLAYEHIWHVGGDGQFSIRADSELSQGYWSDFTHIAGTYQTGYTRSGMSSGYAATDNKWSVRAFVKNIENKGVIEGAYSLPGTPNEVLIAAPRTYGVSGSVRF